MPARKNEWLNAKPMTKTGGKSGGVRNPKKPYKKPAKPASEKPARWEAKTKSERLQEAAKTKAKSPAPKQVIKKPVTRTGPVKGPVAPKGSTGPVTMPNSARRSYNLPKAANSVTPPKSGPSLRGTTPGTRNTTPAKPAPKPSVKPPSTLRRAGGSLVTGTILTTAAGKALETLGKAAQPSEWKRVQKELKDRGYGSSNKPNPANSRGSRGGAAAGTRTRSSNSANPTSALQGRVGNANVNDLRRGQEEARKAQLERANRGQRSTTQSGGGSTQSRSGGGGTSRSSSPARQSGPAMPKKPFTGSVSEGRKMWAEKYSSSKYDGQAIQKEAKALLKKMKEEKNNQSSAQRAGWDGNKNY